MIIITKRKLREILQTYKDGERVIESRSDYGPSISEEQMALNAYYSGYVDGCDNIINAVAAKFKLNVKQYQ